MPRVPLLQQEDVLKLTEKCDLSSTGGSPVVTPQRIPEDLKSNILKAQAEAAAALKVRYRIKVNWTYRKRRRRETLDVQ